MGMPSNISMSDEDLGQLSCLVDNISFVHASDGRKYCYFFPSDDNNVADIQNLLAKYNVPSTSHKTRVFYLRQPIVRVRYTTVKQRNSIVDFVEKVQARKLQYMR